MLLRKTDIIRWRRSARTAQLVIQTTFRGLGALCARCADDKNRRSAKMTHRIAARRCRLRLTSESRADFERDRITAFIRTSSSTSCEMSSRALKGHQSKLPRGGKIGLGAASGYRRALSRSHRPRFVSGLRPNAGS